MSERHLRIPPAARSDLSAFLGRLLRTDESAVVRVRRRGTDAVEVWAATGFGVLAVRVLPGAVAPDSLVASAPVLAASLRAGDGLTSRRSARPDDELDTGYAMDSAWRGALPPSSGFVSIDSVPSSVLRDLAERGAAIGRETGGPAGPPPSLLDSHVLRVDDGHGIGVDVALRTTFALQAMGFAGDGPDEPVRVRATATWVRLDARYGSLYQRAVAGPKLFV